MNRAIYAYVIAAVLIASIFSISAVRPAQATVAVIYDAHPVSSAILTFPDGSTQDLTSSVGYETYKGFSLVQISINSTADSVSVNYGYGVGHKGIQVIYPASVFDYVKIYYSGGPIVVGDSPAIINFAGIGTVENLKFTMFSGIVVDVKTIAANKIVSGQHAVQVDASQNGQIYRNLYNFASIGDKYVELLSQPHLRNYQIFY